VDRPVVDSMMAEMAVVEIEYVALDIPKIVLDKLMFAGSMSIEMVMTLFDQMVIAGLLEVG